ncbi:MAG: CRISPR-associated protein [Muribaculaceae bacterium]|nr:CRISPR-associated protein [Muribaculaceae bacterium]
MTFLNFTNHPSSAWSQPQIEAARALGDIVDLDFPNVDADSSEAVISDMADLWVEKIISQYSLNDLIVHIQGEQTLCFAIISRLLDLGVRCIASCSRRDVELMPDGSRSVKFHFSQFRDYIR